MSSFLVGMTFNANISRPELSGPHYRCCDYARGTTVELWKVPNTKILSSTNINFFPTFD